MQTSEDAEHWLAILYLDLTEMAAPLIGPLIRDLADPRRRPIVFHCAGGKDRTGLTAAILLSALGVARPLVLDDHELTSKLQSTEITSQVAHYFVSAAASPEGADAVLGTPRWAMAHALDVLDERYGGAETYLRDRARVGGDAIEQLRSDLPR